MIQSVAHMPEALGLIVEYLQNLNDDIIVVIFFLYRLGPTQNK